MVLRPKHIKTSSCKDATDTVHVGRTAAVVVLCRSASAVGKLYFIERPIAAAVGDLGQL